MKRLTRTSFLLFSFALVGATMPDRFEARGSNPRWTLRIAPDGLRFDRILNGKKQRDEGRLVGITHSPGRAEISAVIVEYEFHPLGIKGPNGAPISNVEGHEVALSIEVLEADCTDTKGRSFPTRVTITDAGDSSYRGCGGALTTLTMASSIAVAP